MKTPDDKVVVLRPLFKPATVLGDSDKRSVESQRAEDEDFTETP